MTWQTMRDAARTLTVNDRLLLVEALWEEIADEPALEDLSPEFVAELDRRIQNAENSPDAGRPWRDVLMELRAADHASRRPAT
jgi:putative addiction module component (TIGR02574 family)